MGDVVLLNPNGIHHGLSRIRKTEIENIFRMGITDRETERRFADQSVEEDVFVILLRGDVDEDVFAVNTHRDN
jgi:hypothetical protein